MKTKISIIINKYGKLQRVVSNKKDLNLQVFNLKNDEYFYGSKKKADMEWKKFNKNLKYDYI